MSPGASSSIDWKGRRTAVESDVFEMVTGTYMPDGRAAYGLLPRCRKKGRKVFSYPAELDAAGVTGLSEHAAPGDAIVFALEGEAHIGYEGERHPIKAGESFHFAKGGLHSVEAQGRFKMALLLTVE